MKLKKLTNRNWGVSMEFRIMKINHLIQGWGNYFKVGDIKKYAEKIDAHTRRRLRACRWKEWKKPKTRYKNLIKLGVSKDKAKRCANSRKKYWCISKSPQLDFALNNEYWQKLGLKSLYNVIS